MPSSVIAHADISDLDAGPDTPQMPNHSRHAEDQRNRRIVEKLDFLFAPNSTSRRKGVVEQACEMSADQVGAAYNRVKERIDAAGNPEGVCDYDLFLLLVALQCDVDRVVGMAQLADEDGRAFRALFRSTGQKAMEDSISSFLKSGNDTC